MHKEALQWIADNRPSGPQVVLDLGSREAGSGRVRDLFTDSIYVGLDAQAGPGVDHIADITEMGTWPEFDPFTLVICAEVFEHEANWPFIVHNAFHSLDTGGTFLITAAGNDRPPHTCRPLAYSPTGEPDQDGGYPPNPGEWYRNIGAFTLHTTLVGMGFSIVKIDGDPEHHDIYARCEK